MALRPPKGEGEFNSLLRSRIRAQGLQALHVRDADQEGVFDLIVHDQALLLGWVELKYEDRALRTTQVAWANMMQGRGPLVVINWVEGFRAEILGPGAGNDWTRLAACGTIDDVRIADWAETLKQHTV